MRYPFGGHPRSFATLFPMSAIAVRSWSGLHRTLIPSIASRLTHRAVSLAGDPIEHTVFGEGIHIHNHTLLTPRLKGRSAA
jgi:hypothetical protein